MLGRPLYHFLNSNKKQKQKRCEIAAFFSLVIVKRTLCMHAMYAELYQSPIKELDASEIIVT